MKPSAPKLILESLRERITLAITQDPDDHSLMQRSLRLSMEEVALRYQTWSSYWLLSGDVGSRSARLSAHALQGG